MAEPVEVVTKKAKIDEPVNGDVCKNSILDAHFAQFRPDLESRCTWDKNATMKESPHLHDDNL